MKNFFIIVLFFCSLSLFGQTSRAHLESGISKQEKQDFNGAIKDYSNAIAADANNKEAYYNRGTCQLILKNLEAAKQDFTQTIALDAGFVKAYYSRATVFVSQERYHEALPDLSKTIELNPKTPNALTLRGQIRAQTGNKLGACEDFNLAKKLGDPKAGKYIDQFCQNTTENATIKTLQQKESLELKWPKNWKVGDDQEDANQHVVDYIPEYQDIDNWTALGNMTTVKNVAGVPMDKAMNLMYERMKVTAPEAKLTFIEKEENATYPWIIFTIESPRFTNDDTPESQLWYIVQGKQSLYLNFRAIKKASIADALKVKWTAFFKTAKIVNE